MCNPHDTFNNQIVNRYGTVCLKKVKEFTRLRIKRIKLECGLNYAVKCRDSDVIPKFSRIKPIQCIRDSDTFFHTANMKLLRRVIAEYRRKVMYINKQVYELHLQLSQVLQQDLWQVLDAMTYNRSARIKCKVEGRHRKKLNGLKLEHQNKTCFRSYPHFQNVAGEVTSTDDSNSVVNLSSYELSSDAQLALSRGLNYAPAPQKIPVEEIVTSIEDTLVRNRVPFRDAECIRQDISSMLRRLKPPKSNISVGELKALKDLRNNEEVLVLTADKGNATVVVNTADYERKVNELVSDSNIYKKVNYNPTARVTTKVVKLLKESEDIDLVTRLRPQNPTAPKIYGLPKIHKPDWPLRPIVSQIDAPTYKLSKHLASVLQPLTGKTDSHVRDSRHFVNLLSSVRIQPDEIMVSFDVVSLFTNVPVEDSIKVISDLIQTTNLPTEYTKWTEYCLKSGYFVWRGDYYLQMDGVAMGSPIAPVVANIFMEWFEACALKNAPIKPRYWWRYVDDVFAIVTRDNLPDITQYLNSIHENIAFSVEEERNGSLPFLDVRVIKKPDGTLTHTVYRKPTHTDRYLKADSHHHPAHLASVASSLINRALAICDTQYVDAELQRVRGALERNGYRWRQCSRWASRSTKILPDTVQRSPVYLPFVKGVTDKVSFYLKRRYDIRTLFRSSGQLRRMVRSPKDKEPLSGPGVYRIPCDCGKSYIGETRRNISTRVHEHIRSVKNVDTVRSAVAEHAHTPDSQHYLRFDKTSVLSREKFYVPRKVREAIEISRYPNFNRDGGWTVSPSWKPALTDNTYNNKNTLLWTCEADTTSAVCLTNQTDNSDSDHSSDVDVELPLLSERRQTSPTPPAAVPAPAPRSARQLRAEARCARSLR